MNKEIRCRLCEKTCHEIHGYLTRVNEKGVDGIWECRPSCDSRLNTTEAVLAAIDGDPSTLIETNNGY